MLLKRLFLFTLTLTALFEAKANLTFKNVMVICENENPSSEELTFVTIVTGNSLKQHFSTGQDCFRIEIEHSNLPIVFDGAFANINRVHYLLLENNNIKDIQPGAFTNLTVLEGMSLKFNKLTDIKNGVFNNVTVPFLYLSWNYISTIHPRAFDDMPTLEAIYLDNNKLTFIDNNWFKNCPKLHTLVFKHNLLERVPRYAFKNLASKRYNEAQINLSNNFIRFVDVDAFKKPKRFRYLSLANNQIYELRGEWLEGVEVKKLDISRNNLQCLMGNGLAGQYSTNYIGGNPWICSCLEEMKRKEENGTFGHIVANEEFSRCNI